MQQQQSEKSERQMKETPLIYSTDNVKRVLLGLKTQTRRTTGLKKINNMPYLWCDPFYDEVTGFWNLWQRYTGDVISVKCPYGEVDDRLWVREAWNYNLSREEPLYRADGGYNEKRHIWKPSIFMFKKDARIWLTLTEPCRLERLQDISDEDIFAEGLESAVAIGKDGWDSPIDWYSKQWDRLHGKGAWIKNEWVWVITHYAFGVRFI